MRDTVLFKIAGFVAGSVCLLNGGCGSSAPQKPRMIGIRVVYEVGHPGVIVGIVTRPGQAPECPYLLLLKAPAAGVAHTQQVGPGEGSYSDRNVEEKQRVTLDGCRLDIHYKLDFGTGSESLSLNDSSIDWSKGRVFLVEQTTGGPVYKQMNVSPSALGTPTLDNDFAFKAAAEMSKQDAEIKQFLEGK